MSAPTQRSGAGRSGGAALVRTPPENASSAPYVARARTRSTGAPSSRAWTSEACPVAMVRPSRRISVVTVAGPAALAERQ